MKSILLLLAVVASVFAAVHASQVLPSSILSDASEIANLKPEAASLHDPIDQLASSVLSSAASSYNAPIPAALSVLPTLPPAEIPIEQKASDSDSFAEIAALDKRDEHDAIINEAARVAEKDMPNVNEVIDSAKDVDNIHPALAVLGEKVEEHTNEPAAHEQPHAQQPEHLALTEMSAQQKRGQLHNRGPAEDLQAAAAAAASQFFAQQNAAAAAVTTQVETVGTSPAHIKPRLTGAAGRLSQSDARCVICQFLVQQLHVKLTTAPGGAGAGAGAGEAQAFLEVESEIEAAINAEAAESASFQAEANNWLAAATAAEEHSATAAEATYFGLPRNLNDHGETPKRFRNPDMLAYRPAVARYNGLNDPNPSAAREKKRALYQKLYSDVYSHFSSICARRFPLAYLPYCENMLRDYRYVAQGLHYGDRPEAICMNGNFCDAESYIRNQPHVAFTREAGDA